MDEPDFSFPPHLREKSWPGIAISLGIFLGFIITAHLIGREYSCTPVASIYYLGGLMALPILFAMPLVFAPRLHVVLRACTGLLNAGLGIVMWAWAHDAGGMYFMCRLF